MRTVDPGASTQDARPGFDLVFPALAFLAAFVSIVPYPFIESAEVMGAPVLRFVPLAVGALLLAAVLGFRYMGRRPPEGVSMLALPVLLLVGVELLSGIGSVEPVRSVAKAAFYTVTGVVFFFAAGYLRHGSARRLLWLVLALSAVVGAVSVYEFFNGAVPFFEAAYLRNNPYYLYPDLAKRSFATIGHPVFLGAYFVIAMPAGFYLAGSEEGPRLRVLAFAMTAVSAVGLFFTFSRGAYAAVLISAFVFYWGRVTRRQVLVAAAVLAAVVGIAALSGSVRQTIEERNPWHEYVERSGQAHRLKAYELTARVLGDVPLLGMGVGNYRHLYEMYRAAGDDTRQTYATPDNMYLVTLAEAGLAGLGLFIFILYRAWSRLDSARRRAANGVLPLAGMAILAGFAFDMLFFDALYVEPVRVMFWTVLGVACREA